MKYRDNTVKGSRRGKKWPEEIKTAAMCDLLINNNLSEVARRYNVPESTLRTWEAQARRKKPGEKKSLFEQARANELRALARRASAAANNSVEYMRRRLEANASDAEVVAWCKRRLDELDGLIADEGPADPDCTELGAPRQIEPEKPGEREQLQQLMERHKPMSDFSAARFASTLVTVADKAGKMSGDGEETGGGTLRVEMAGNEEDFTG